MSALGDLDELNSLLGIIKNLTSPPGGEISVIIQQIQEDLFIIQAHVASDMFEKLYKPPQFTKNKVATLEREIARFETKLNPIHKFVIPGMNEDSAWLDYARTIARRVERSVLRFSEKEKIAPEILAYLNRLSSLLFVMARVAAKNSKEKNPKYK